MKTVFCKIVVPVVLGLIVLSCVDGTQMRRQLYDLQARNQADSLLTDDSLALSLCDWFDSHGTPNEQMLAHYLLARTYTDMGEAPQALDEFHRAAACADTTSTDCDYSLLARAYGQMAELLYVNELPRNALHAFLQAYHFSGLAQETNIASYYFSQQGKCYYDLMLPDSAIIIAEQAIQMLYECGDTLAANTLKGPIAYGLIERGEYDKAKEYLYSYENCSFINEESLKQIENYKLLYIYKGFYYQHIAETDSALYYYHKAYQTSSSPNNQALAFQGLYKTYELLHKPDSVGKYASIYAEKNDKVVKLSASSALLSMQYLYDYQSFQTLAKEKSLEAAQTRQSLIVLAFTLLLIAALSCGIIYYLRNRQRITKQRMFAKYTADVLSLIAVKKELKILQSQDVINKHLVKQAQEDLEYLRKNVAEASRKFSDTDSWGLADALQQTEIVKHLKKKGIKGIAATEQELHSLRRVFTIYQPEFIEVLGSEKYSLTIKDLNICMLIRLGFVPYEICALLKVSSSSLSNQRKRLLQKVFDIEGGASLFDEKIRSIAFEANT